MHSANALDTCTYFIAHASTDSSAARDVAAAFEPHGQCFLDSNSIPLGNLWGPEIECALGSAEALIAVLSNATGESPYVRGEVAYTLERIRTSTTGLPLLVPVYVNGWPTADDHSFPELRAFQGFSLRHTTAIQIASHVARELARRKSDRTSVLVRDQSRQAKIVVYGSGTPSQPADGHTARALAILRAYGTVFHFVPIDSMEALGRELTAKSGWSVPQVYVGDDLIGGSDALLELHERGELAALIWK